MLLRILLLALTAQPGIVAQPAAANTSQQLVSAGLSTVAHSGAATGVASDAAGDVFLLLDDGDGVRLQKNSASTQAHLGAQGDHGIALALDSAGDVYIAGTSSSTTLTGTSGAAIPSRTDSSTNSFVAKFDNNLNLIFVTFTGGSRIAATAVAATADSVFVTGILYGSNLPVTPSGVQQTPTAQSSGNGFVERFSASGSTLIYATYLTGVGGATSPAAIVADSADNAYIAGQTSSSGFPTVAALVPAMLSNPSGFLTRLTPAGDGLTASTFLPGSGLTSLAIDSTGLTLLASGSVALGQFPVDTVTAPLTPASPYQTLLRLPLNLNAVASGTLVAPGTQSAVAAGANGSAWVDGPLSLPLLPTPALSTIGSAFAAEITDTGAPYPYAVTQTARLGGVPIEDLSFASLPLNLNAVAVDPAGNALLAGQMEPTASSSLLATETYDLPLRESPSAALPSSLRQSETSAASCSGSLCSGSAAYLAKLAPVSAAALTFSVDDTPFIVLRNLGSATASGIAFTVSSGSFTSSCSQTLAPGAECALLLTGGAAGAIMASYTYGAAATPASETASFAAYTAPASTIFFLPRELDFGIVSSANPGAAARSVTVANLGSSTQTFTSAADLPQTGSGTQPPKVSSPFSEAASDCATAGLSQTKVLAANSICHITLGFTASATSANDGLITGQWTVGSNDIYLTAISQAAALSLSASEIDFGTQYAGGLRLPRFLYISNSSTLTQAHSAVSQPAGSAFTITDNCPSSLAPATVCQIRIDYLAAQAPSNDTTTLALDDGLSVLVTGKTLPQPGVTGTTVNPDLAVTPAAVAFPSAVVVTSVSPSAETVSIVNSGASAFPLSLTLTGDFSDVTSCGATLVAGATCAVDVSFTPSQPGTRNGLLAISAGSSFAPFYVTLTGNATAILPAGNGSIDFGSTFVNQPVTQFLKLAQPFTLLTLTATGPYSVTLVEDTGFGAGNPPPNAFSSSLSGSCKNCYLGIRFLPTTTGSQPGTLTLSSAVGGIPYALALSGVASSVAGLLITPATGDFGTISIQSSSAPILFTVTNRLASQTAAILTGPAISGDFIASSVPTGAPACSGTLAPGASCGVAVAFAPSATGIRTGSLSVGSSAGVVSAALTGSGKEDPGIALNPSALNFADVAGTPATAQTVMVTNTGAYPAQIGAVSSSAANFQPASTCATLAVGASCSILVSFTPGATLAAGALAIPVTINGAAATYSIALSGNYTTSSAGLAFSPAQVEFGPVTTSSTGPTLLYTLNNLTSKTFALTTDFPRNYVPAGQPCIMLAPHASCAFSVTFIPLSNGLLPGSITVQATPNDGSATLTAIAYGDGYGLGQGTLTLSGGLISNGVYSFGQVPSGQTGSQVFTLSNLNPAGSPAITVRRMTSLPPFLSTTTCGTALQVGQSCSVTVQYTPVNQVASGSSAPPATNDTGLLTIESDAASSPQLLDLTGQGGPVTVSNPQNPAPLATFTLSQGALSFAAVQVGDASPVQTVTLSNTGSVALHVLSLNAPADFTVTTTCATVLPSSTCSLAVSSTPQSSGAKIGAVQIASNSSTSLDFISLVSTASPSPLALNPSSLNFGSVQVGFSSILGAQVTNTSAQPVVFSSIAAPANYAAGGGCQALAASGTALAPNSTCAIQVTFTPTAIGTRSGAVSIASSASTLPLLVLLTGTGIQSHLTLSASVLAYGSIVVGHPANLNLTLQNTGTAAISTLALTATGDYAVTIPCPSTTLAPGDSCIVQVTFNPSALGARPGTLAIVSSDPGSPLAVPLTGTGVPSGSFTLTVDGGPAANVTVVSGQPAAYALTLTSTGGFTGNVALTCTPIDAAHYATCSLNPSSLNLTSSPLNAVATINTVTSVGGTAQFDARPLEPLGRLLLCLLFPGLLTIWRSRRTLRERLPILAAIFATTLTLIVTACGGGNSNPNLRYSPAGSYQYQITASSTSGVTVNQMVTLNLNVLPR